MANIFKEAKKFQRLHPRMDWQTCIQRVSKKRPKKKKSAKSKNRQTGKSNVKADRERHARPPGARIPRGGRKVTYYERRKNRSDVPGGMTGTEGSLKSQLRHLYKKKLGQVLVNRSLTVGKTKKKKLTTTALELKKKLMSL